MDLQTLSRPEGVSPQNEISPRRDKVVHRKRAAIALGACAVLALGWSVVKSEPGKQQEMMRVTQMSCPEQCRGNYGQCMKATANRPVCQSQLDACLKGCVAAKTVR